MDQYNQDEGSDYEEQYDKILNKKLEKDNFMRSNNEGNNQQQQQHYRDYDEEEEDDYGVEQNDTMAKISQYIKVHHVSLKTFWKSSEIQVPFQQFIQFLREINLDINDRDEEDLLMTLDQEGSGLVAMKTVCDKIEPWRKQQNAVENFNQEVSVNIAVNLQKKQNQKYRIQKMEKNRPNTAKYSSGRPISAISTKTTKSRQYNMSSAAQKRDPYNTQQQQYEEDMQQTQQERRPPVPDKSKYYLQKYKERQNEIERLLKLTINKGKNEYEYEMLINMGDANELSQKLNSKITYRAYKGAQGNLKVHVYELDKYLQELTLEEFQREYNIVKNKYNKTQNKNVWENLSETKKQQQQKAFVRVGVDEDKDDRESSKKGFNKQQRVQELKQVLLDTMVLTNTLKEQLAVLNRKGINSAYNQNKTMNHDKTSLGNTQYQ